MGGDVAGDGLCCGLFDNIDDLVDFFIEEEEVLIDNKMDSTPALAEPLFAPPVEDGISCKTSVGASLKHVGLDKPVNGNGNGNGNEDNDWWLKFFEDNTDSFSLNFDDSSSRANTTNAIVGAAQEDSLFHTSSPLSVLEHNSDSSGDGSDSSSSFSSSNSEGNSKDSTLASEPILVVPARARSKRPRPTTFLLRPHVTVPYLPPSTDAQQNPQFTSSELESSITDSDSRKKMKKRKKASFVSTGTTGEMDAEMSERLQVQPSRTRKCMHCGIEKTPQWRAGPMGPKTLCNACGVRYKSGRLFPEYRPAASPTFVPSLHSNSHKKVVEMRIKADQSPSQRGCDLLQYIQIQRE